MRQWAWANIATLGIIEPRESQGELQARMRKVRDVLSRHLGQRDKFEILLVGIEWRLAVCLMGGNDHIGAEEIGRRLLEVAHQAGPMRPLWESYGHLVLAKVSMKQQDYEAAEEHYNAILARSEALDKAILEQKPTAFTLTACPVDLSVPKMYTELGTAYEAQGKLAEARRCDENVWSAIGCHVVSGGCQREPLWLMDVGVDCLRRTMTSQDMTSPDGRLMALTTMIPVMQLYVFRSMTLDNVESRCLGYQAEVLGAEAVVQLVQTHSEALAAAAAVVQDNVVSR